MDSLNKQNEQRKKVHNGWKNENGILLLEKMKMMNDSTSFTPSNQHDAVIDLISQS